MKRFLISFSLIAFVTVSCAGPNKVGLTRQGNDFRQDEFEKDRKECMETAKKEESYSQTSGVFDYCMFKKGYAYQPQTIKGYQYRPPSESSFDEEAYEKITLETVGKILLGVVLIPVVISLGIMFIGAQPGTFKF